MKRKILFLLVWGVAFLAVPNVRGINPFPGSGSSLPDEPVYSIGILGTAINGWEEDVDMTSDDNVHYTLTNFPLKSGYMKFRQDNSWAVNWGSTEFPSGTGYQDGPDIPIPDSGIYDIYFNRVTGEYLFTLIRLWKKVGIIGTAVSPYFDWLNEVKLSTADEITYTLAGNYFTDGEAKFRQDESWDVNWGGSDFPAGAALLNGPNIPVKAGFYKVTFNIQTGEYSFEKPSIGILGTSLTGWTDDIDLETSDGISYSLLNYPFTAGEVKFRQDNNWSLNWGGFDFPAGYSWQDGPNIPVPEGTYNVFFDRMTGEYNFVATTCPVAGIECPDNIYTGSFPGICGAYVYYPDVKAAPNCGGDGITIIQTAGLPSGSLFPIGVTTNTYQLTNAAGNTATCSFDVMVFDFEPPLIENVSASPTLPWPPNHDMIPVTVNYFTHDNCGGMVYSNLFVWSSEPENGTGDGNTPVDFEVTDPHHLLLRAERSGKGTGREYEIILICWDEMGNIAIREIPVFIPHDQRGMAGTDVSGTGSNLANFGSSVKSAKITSVETPFNISVWPNPGSAVFNLDLQSASNEIAELNLFDSSGRIILKKNIIDLPFRFGEELSPGVYFIRIQQGESIGFAKIVKQ